MREQWYGDNRDVVKWSTLVHLARREAIRHILQIAMLRSDDDRPRFRIFQTDRAVPMPEEVVHHFSRGLELNDIQRLADSTDLCIDVIDEWFTDRQKYFDGACELITRYGAPIVAFLDPDTGLASQHRGLQHVAKSDLVSVFKPLRSGSLMVCYQHSRRERGWEEDSRKKFACWTGVSEAAVEIFKSELASDVILLAVKKP